jgi:hypothetical protein
MHVRWHGTNEWHGRWPKQACSSVLANRYRVLFYTILSLMVAIPILSTWDSCGPICGHSQSPEGPVAAQERREPPRPVQG